MNTAAKIGLVLILASGVGTGIYFGFIKKDADGKTWMDRMTKPKEDKKEAEEEKKDTAPASPPPVTPQPSSHVSDNESFPLEGGMRGPKVRALQMALINKFSIGIKGAPGPLGNNTKNAIEHAGYSLPISREDYDNILAGKKKGTTSSAPKTGPPTFNPGDSIYAKNDGTPIYSYPESSAKYIIVDSNTNPYKFNKSTSPMGTFTKVAGSTGFIEANVGTHGKVYVKASQIKSSAY